MAKVIRRSHLSDSPVHIGAKSEPDPVPLEGFVTLVDQLGRMGEDLDDLSESDDDEASEGPLEEGAPLDSEASPDESEEMAEGEDSGQDDPQGEDESGGSESGEPDAEGQSSEEPQAPEEPPGYTAVQLEEIVEERLKEFEARFQSEKEAAYRSGFDDGREEGLKEGQEQSRQEVERFGVIIDRLGPQWQDVLKTADADLTDLAVAIASRIIGASVDTSREPVLTAVRECLGYLEDKSRVVVRVHPVDLEAVRRHRNEWLESLEGMEQLLIEADNEISPGGCVIETPKGDVDAQVEERLDKLRSVLVETIRHQENDRSLETDPIQDTADDPEDVSSQTDPTENAEQVVEAPALDGEPDTESETGSEMDSEPEPDSDPETDSGTSGQDSDDAESNGDETSA